jgi:uncharacterized membrane protein
MGWTARMAVIAGLALAGLAQPAAAAEERCYGVARAGQNDGIDGREEPGSATVDWQGNAWTMVPEGSCLTMALPPRQDGTPRRGSFEPLERDRP